MIIIDKPKLKFLLAGRSLTITVPDRKRPYRAKRIYAVGLTHRRSVCHAEILGIEQTADGIRLQIRQASIDQPNLLAARSEFGYTSKPHLAMRGEPEAVAGSQLDRIAAKARQQPSLDEHARSLEIRLKDARKRRDADAIAVIRHELAVLEHRIRQAA